jgi:hypothetical protein
MSEKKDTQCPCCYEVEAEEDCVYKTMRKIVDGKEVLYCCENLHKKLE